MSDQMVASATNFLTGVIIGRTCAPEQFGLYMLGFSVILVLMRLQVALISTPYMVYSPRYDGQRRAIYTGSVLVHEFVLSGFTVLALVVAGSILSLSPSNHDFEAIVWALAFAVGWILLREFVRNVCFAQLAFARALVIDVCVAIVQLGLLMILAYRGLLSAWGAFVVIGAAAGLAAPMWYLRGRHEVVVRLRAVSGDFRHNWMFGRWIFASGLIWELSLNAYPWVLAVFHGTASAGAWAACFGAVALANPALLGVQNYLGPMIAHAYAEAGSVSLRRFVIGAGAVFTMIVLPFAVVLVLAGGRVVELVYGSSYRGLGLVVAVLALDLMSTPMRFALSRALFAMERASADFASNLVPLLVLLLAGLWLVRVLGPLGVAVSMLIASVAVTSVKYAMFVIFTRHAARTTTG